MKRVLLIIPSNSGTIASVFYNLYKAFLIQKNIIVYVANMSYDLHGDFLFESILNLNKKSCGYIEKIIKLKKIKKDYNIDVSISALSSCNTLNLLSKGRDKTIGIFHAPLSQNKILGIKTYLLSYLSYKLIYNRLDKLCCVSESIKNDVLKNIRVNRDKVEVVYNIHDIQNIREKSIAPIEVEYEPIFAKNVLLFIGKLYSIKSPDRLLRAYAEIKNKEPQVASNINVLFIGRDVHDTQKKLNRIIEEYDIKDHVFFIGSQVNPYKFVKRAKMLVSSSKSEGLPGVIIESLLINTPVIASDSSIGIWEILGLQYSKSNINVYASKGIITTNNNVSNTLESTLIEEDDKKMADAIMEVFQNKVMYAKMKQANFLFEQEISPDNCRKYLI